MRKVRRLTTLAVVSYSILLAVANYCYGDTAQVVAANDEFQQAVRGLRAKQLNSIELASAVENEFRKNSLLQAIDRVSTATSLLDLRALFDALNTKAFYSDSRVNAFALEKFALLLKERADLRASEAKAVFGALVAARDFDRAKYFQKLTNVATPEPLPQTIDATIGKPATTLWFVNASKRVLERKSIPELHGVQLVVVASLDCQYSVRALNTVTSNDALMRSLPPVAYWIVPPERSLIFSKLQAWNSDHKLLQFALANAKDEWPFIDSWDTPEFYFLRDGKVVDRLTGWPRDGSNEQKLLSKLRELSGSAPAK